MIMKRFKMKRKSERWVSNNRVLLGSSKKDPGRNPNFDTEETKLLISLWGDPKVQRTLITTHRKHTVIAKLAEKMGEYGYNRSAEEINTRIKNLKCFYNRLKRDMELGTIDAATWKHYPAMDEIMTRSIFSVRPNEVPKPSLKYQLEIEQREREERNKLRVANAKMGKHSTTSNVSTFDENMTNSGDDSFSQTTAVLDENVVQINCDELMKYVEDEDNYVKVKEEKCPESEEETSLLIPKDEPIDGDIEIRDVDSETIKSNDELLSGVSEFIQISSNAQVTTTTSPICRISTINGSIATTIPSSSIVSPMVKTGITPSIIFANQAKPMPATGKISLVPTNFLLQPNASQTQQIQIRPQHQQRIICSQPNPQPTMVSSGPSRMKVLLVNTFQNGKAPNNTAPMESTFTNANLIPTANILNTQDATPVMKNSVESPKPTKPDEVPLAKNEGVEMMFNKLIVIQNENNDIQRQRLEIERQRFEFEKSVLEKLLAAFTSSNPVPSAEFASFPGTGERRASIEMFTNDKTRTMNLADGFNGYQLVTPKIEKDD